MSDPRARIDAAGVEHPVAAGTVRIVSLVPSITELLFALDLGPAVVGRTRYCVHPAPAVAGIESVGGTKRPSLETLRRLHPTHVIVNVEENRLSDVEAVRAFGCRVVVTYPAAPLDNLGLYRLLGAIFAREAHALALRDRFLDRYEHVAELGESRPREPVLYLIWRKPWMSVSLHTYIGRMLALIGWISLFEGREPRYPTLTAGEVDLSRVRRCLFSSEPFPFADRHLDEFSQAFGYARARCLPVDGERLSWYGSRALAGLDYLAELATRRHC